MLIRLVLSSDVRDALIAPGKSSSQPIGPPSRTRHGWFRLPPIDQYLTAASRRSMGRVSVPLWGAFLSEPLPIAALVGRYPANKLIGREPIRRRRNFQYAMPCGIISYGD